MCIPSKHKIHKLSQLAHDGVPLTRESNCHSHSCLKFHPLTTIVPIVYISHLCASNDDDYLQCMNLNKWQWWCMHSWIIHKLNRVCKILTDVITSMMKWKNRQNTLYYSLERKRAGEGYHGIRIFMLLHSYNSAFVCQ